MSRPDLRSYLGDITQLGVPYTLTTPDANDYVFATFPIDNNEIRSIFARVMLADETLTPGPLDFGQFEIAGIFMNIGGVVNRKNDVDKITNKMNINSQFYFRIVGETVEIVCNSGVNSPTRWIGTIAVLKATI